jgi:hypothetical protein
MEFNNSFQRYARHFLGRMIFAVIIALTAYFLGMGVSDAKRIKSGKNATQQKAGSELHELMAADFPRWDSNHDGVLSAAEINALIENPQVTGDEAAAVVVIRKNFSQDGDENESAGLTRAQLLALADENEIRHAFLQNKNHIKTINHALFLPNDPNLFTFHQGRIGDCYLLAVVGAYVNRDPQAVRMMIKTLPGNVFRIDFASGQQIVVPPATDSELLQGARLGSNCGVWLSILEKAYANIRETKRKNEDIRPVAPDDDVPKDYLGGGRPGLVIEQFTGHKANHVALAGPTKNDLTAKEKQIDGLLIQLTRERRLMAVGTSGEGKSQLPPKIPHGHVFGVLGYDSTRHIVHVFNPWGNNVTPAGPPGLSNGYVTRHGMFDVPLGEFIQIFKALTYETDQPLDKA